MPPLSRMGYDDGPCGAGSDPQSSGQAQAMALGSGQLMMYRENPLIFNLSCGLWSEVAGVGVCRRASSPGLP